MENTELKRLQDAVNENLQRIIKLMPSTVDLVGESTIKTIYFLGWHDCIRETMRFDEEKLFKLNNVGRTGEIQQD